MRVLMISLDKGLVGGRPLGDVIERHKKYGEFVDKLDIIVMSRPGFRPMALSKKVQTYPTNSRLWFFSYVAGALKIGRRLFKNTAYDLIVTQDPFQTGKAGYRLKKEFGAKFLVHFHGDFDRFPKLVVEEADAVRVMSAGQKEKLIIKGLKAEKIRVISTPIDLERFMNFESQASPHQKESLNSLRMQLKDKFVILMVSRKDKVKDFDTLSKAVRIVKEKKGHDSVTLWLVGNYTLQDAPPNLLDLITFGEARIDAKDLPVRYCACNVVVLPSRSESFGKVLIEANACGKPVVATATTGAKEIIRNGHNGFLVPIGDARALAEKIIYFFDNPGMAKAMGENGRRLVKEKYSDNTQKLVAFWKDIVGSQTKHSALIH